MAQVIIFQNENNGVSVCYPTGELTIEEVLAKDCPEGAIIVDDSALPTDQEFFNSWELVNGKVIVNQAKKQAIIDKKQAAIDAKVSTQSKLEKLGLTADEIKHLLG